MSGISHIETARLVLREAAQDDIAAYVAFYADAEASKLYGGPLDRAQAWRKLAMDIGHWALRGHGMWSLRLRDNGAMVGGCGIVWPEGWPRPELTWWILPMARRQRYALEASTAVIRFGYNELGWRQVETHMRDDNEAARQLALKLGGVRIAREVFPDGIPRDVYALPRPAD